MERALIIKQYLELRDYLNTANKLANQPTEMKFSIEQVELFKYRLFATIATQHEQHRIALTERGPNKTWERTGHSRFRDLENYVAEFLNQREEERRLLVRSSLIPESALQDWAKKLDAKIKMLLLNENYEP